MKKIKIFLPIMISIVLVILIIILINNKYFVIKDGIKYSLVSSREIKIDSNADSDTFLIQKFESSEGQARYFFRTKKYIFNKNEIEMNGFEDEVANCKQFELFLGEEHMKTLCFTGNVGVHSQNLVLIGIDNNKPKIINFIIDQEKEPNIFSDVPKIIFSDYDGDQIKELIVENRNYESDPINSVTKNYFRYSGSEFVFDRKISI